MNLRKYLIIKAVDVIKVSDYIVKRLVKEGFEHVFMISGGGAMHLNDSVGKCKDIKYICNHHEQASAIAAEGYSRVSGKPAAVIVTTGPGGLNTLTGLMGQWTDSIPVIYISGQVKRQTCVKFNPDIGLRQLGDQEADITNVIKPLTKYATTVEKPEDIKHIIDKALFLMTDKRPGPVWIDVPIDIQGALVDEESLKGFKPEKEQGETEFLKEKVRETYGLVKQAKKPVIVAGHGIRIAKARELFKELAKKLQIPVVSTFNGFDLIDSDNPLFIGRIGTVGDRAGNFALQNADVVLFLGTRNNIRQVSYNSEFFVRNGKKIVVDIDRAELEKSTVKPDIAINCDVKYFLAELKGICEKEKLPSFKKWLNWCAERKNRYPAVLPEYRKEDRLINPYYFMEVLTSCMKEKDIAVAGNGTACVCLFQAGRVKKGQRIFWNSGCASMGYDLPAAIGACFANGQKDVICIAGDGSLMMNIQELQTVCHHKLPIKLFILNNECYISIRQTQDAFFEGRYIASGEDSGVSIPDFVKVAEAFGLPAVKIKSCENLKENIEKVLNTKGPLVCEVMLETDYVFSPKLSSEKLPDGRIISKPLEDMYPFLSREEFKGNMETDLL